MIRNLLNYIGSKSIDIVTKFEVLKSKKQYPTKQQLYSHLPPILKTIQDEQDMPNTAGEARRNS